MILEETVSDVSNRPYTKAKSPQYGDAIKDAIKTIQDSYQEDDDSEPLLLGLEDFDLYQPEGDYVSPASQGDSTEYLQQEHQASTSVDYQDSDSILPEERDTFVMTTAEVKEEIEAEIKATLFNDTECRDYRNTERLNYTIITNPSLFWLLEAQSVFRTTNVNYGQLH